VTLDDMLAVMRRHVIEPPLFLPMASRVFGVMSTIGPDAFGIAFHRRMADRLERAGAGLERHFGELARGEGSALLRRSFALILGLWQLSLARGAGIERTATPSGAGASSGVEPRELDRALRALWHGSLHAPATR